MLCILFCQSVSSARSALHRVLIGSSCFLEVQTSAGSMFAHQINAAIVGANSR